jgi:integrase
MATVRKRVWTDRSGQEKSAWVLDYFDQHGKRHAPQFSTKKEAEARRIEIGGEVVRGVHTPERQSITVRAAADLWVQHGNRKKRERGTMRGYEGVVRLHIGPTLGVVKLAQLSTPGVEQWCDRLLDGTSERAPLSLRRTHRVLSILTMILSEAQRRGLVAQNVALPVKIDVQKRREKKLEVGIDIPGKDDARRLLAASTGRSRVLAVLGLFTGMRIGEVRGLPWSAVNFEKRTITVRQRADEYNDLGLPKSQAGQRTIPMAPIVFNTLREWKLACPKSDLDLVFPTNKGTPWALSNIAARIWNPLQREAGLVGDAGKPLFHIHTMRHFAASNWIELGFTPKRLQALLGHSSIQMTYDKYGHLFPSDEDDHARFARSEIGLTV